jgi:hypothetical protein
MAAAMVLHGALEDRLGVIAHILFPYVRMLRFIRRQRAFIQEK